MTIVSGRMIAARFELDRRLGSGGMADVWLARDTASSVEVALKFALPSAGREARAALEREAEIGRRLRHPNIVRLLNDGEEDGVRYLVFEYAPGPSLRELIDWRGSLPESTVLEVGNAVAAALQHAHARGVLHNDLKPGNIIMTPTGGPKVLDFGAASSLSDTLGPARARELMGTIAYLAPEVLQGEPATPRSDIYALGLTLFEAATGRLPFPGSNPAAVAGQRLVQPAPRLRQFAPTASPRLESVVGIALSLDPAQRFASGEQFAGALAAPLPQAQQPTVAFAVEPSPQTAPDSPSPRRGPRWPLAVALGGLLVTGAGVALFFDDRRDEPDGDAQALAPVVTATPETPTPAPPTPTPVPPTATPTRESSGNSDGNFRNDDDNRGNGNSGNRGRGRGNSRPQLPALPTVEVPSPSELRDALSDLFESWRESLERDD